MGFFLGLSTQLAKERELMLLSHGRRRHSIVGRRLPPHATSAIADEELFASVDRTDSAILDRLRTSIQLVGYIGGRRMVIKERSKT